MYIDIHTEHINITIIITYTLPEPRRAVKKRNSSLKAVMFSVTLARRTNVKFSNVTLYIVSRRFSSKRNYPLYMTLQKHNPALITQTLHCANEKAVLRQIMLLNHTTWKKKKKKPIFVMFLDHSLLVILAKASITSWHSQVRDSF